MSFGKELRELRKKQNLTAEDVAGVCGISRSFITLIESEKRLPGKKLIPKIAAALHVKTVVVLNWYLEDISQRMQKDFETS